MSGPGFCWRRRHYAREYWRLQYLSGHSGDCSISTDISQLGAVQVIQVMIFPGHLAHLVSVWVPLQKTSLR